MTADDIREALRQLEASIRNHPRLGPMARREKCPVCDGGRVEALPAIGLLKCLDCRHRWPEN
jgi:hypothetical protein